MEWYKVLFNLIICPLICYGLWEREKAKGLYYANLKEGAASLAKRAGITCTHILVGVYFFIIFGMFDTHWSVRIPMGALFLGWWIRYCANKPGVTY